jgi:hypothetical protein
MNETALESRGGSGSFAALLMKNPTSKLLLALALTSTAALAADDKPSPIGYSDTPIIPGTQWKVHDIDRPRPEAVKPGEKLGDAPSDAIIIFNGTSSDALQGKKKDEKGKDTGEFGPCPWKIENGEMLIAGGDCWTKQEFASCQVHLEWKSEPHTKGNSQKKGNAGIFFMDRYECQMLDCDNNPTYADGMTGCIYGQTPPLVNAVKKAGEPHEDHGPHEAQEHHRLQRQLPSKGTAAHSRSQKRAPRAPAQYLGPPAALI